ncbi:hypothetical protein [Kineosporia sp. NBRC 101731]|uniref:hypothetical protein n=1 Tax=Kineosporia sp. NBRC 101731 TaxID=3032199 RepID=UPI0024A06F4B|nr:hypothetical protein [Kineosporia sp. NBRC 101731]GLY29446.1 hypothetical protein Kisp02_28110 [Kineosporia sp. NBRC 101731]
MPPLEPLNDLPAAARTIARTTIEAVDAALAGDVVLFEEAAARLALCEPEQVRLVLGNVVRDLLEHLNPDGLASDDLLELIRSCARRAFTWYPTIDVNALIVVLTGALGLQEDEDETKPIRYTPAQVAQHAPLFITELLSQPRPAPLTLPQYLRAAFDQLRTAELNEMP